jgi:hypothetical protein
METDQIEITDAHGKGATYRLVTYRRSAPMDGLTRLLAETTGAGVTAYYARNVPDGNAWPEETTDPDAAVVLPRDEALAALKRIGPEVWGLEPVEAP